jgi:hypothetical protein
MKKITFLLLTILVFNYAGDQKTLKDEDELTEHSAEVMEHFSHENFSKAFEILQEVWPLPQNELAQLESQSIKQFNLIGSRYGDLVSVEFIKDENIKDFAIRKTYLMRYQRHMIQFIFIYYKGGNEWILNGFQWNDQVEDLFE